MRPQNKNLKPPWKPGQSGNPKGFFILNETQKEVRRDAREMLKAASPLAVERLIQAINSPDEKNAIRACVAILDKTIPTLTLNDIHLDENRPKAEELRRAIESIEQMAHTVELVKKEVEENQQGQL